MQEEPPNALGDIGLLLGFLLMCDFVFAWWTGRI